MRIKQKSAAFSLVELVVVISFLAAIIAVLVPINIRNRQRSISFVCTSRIKDTGVVLYLYSQDWFDKLPICSDSRLPYKLSPYLGYDDNDDYFSDGFFHCPAQSKRLDVGGRFTELGTSAVGSYGYNYFLFYGIKTGSETFERKISNIIDPSQLPVYACSDGEIYKSIGGGGGQIMDYHGPHPKALEYGFMGGYINPSTVARTHRSGPAPNHGGNCNILMADFAVKAIDVCEDGQFPWTDYNGTNFHPSRASSRGLETP